MKASDLLVKALENEGVKYIFGVPGEENLDFLESLRQSSIKFIITRHEQAAGFMAATVGRLTGNAGVCLSTLGPGATNLVTAVAYANLGGMPLVVITGQKPIKKSKQGHFQMVDIVKVLGPVTKLNKQIVSGDSIAASVREAFRVANEEKPGAVHLELPEDIAKEETTAEVFLATRARRPAADEKAVLQAVAMIQEARHPLILIGAGGNRKLISKMLREFINKTGIPFFNTQMGKGVVDERHPLFLGTAALSENDCVHCAIEQADLIINVGHDVMEKPPFFMKRDGQKVIHINFFSAKIDEVYFPQHEVVGDIANAVWQISEKIMVQKHWDFYNFMLIRESFIKKLIVQEANDSFPLSPRRLVKEVREAIPEDGIVTLDNGMYKIWFARNFFAYNSNTLLLDNALATMGAGLPSAMAAKIIYPEKKVLAVAGDGGFMMNSQELETAVRLQLDLVILVLVDNGYGMIDWKQKSLGFGDFGLKFGNPDFKKYAESYGANGYTISSVAELNKLLSTCLEKSGVHLIAVPIDYSHDLEAFAECTKCNIH